MARYLQNYVTFYGPVEETHQAMGELTNTHKNSNGHDGPEIFEEWQISTDAVVRLDPFETRHWDSPKEYLSELSDGYPNVVIEWSYLGDDHDFYCSIFKNGHSLAEIARHRIGKRSGRELAEKFYYRKAIRLIKMADAS